MVERLLAKEEVASSNLVFRSIHLNAEVAEWQTRQSQKLLGGNLRVGSSPTFGTSHRQPRVFDTSASNHYNATRKLPSCVVVAQGTLNP